MKIVPLIFCIALTAVSLASAANYNSGDQVTVTRPVDLFFTGQLYQHAEEGDTFTVLAHRPAQKQLFVAARDKDGKDIALSLADDAVSPATNAVVAGREAPKSHEAPEAHNSQGIVLANTWEGISGSSSSTVDDLGRLFSAVAKPAANISADPSILVYDEIAYLTPLETALKTLRLPARRGSKSAVTCAGIPRDSLYYYTFDGAFDGKYNKMYIVVDRADQVVSIALVADGENRTVAASAISPWKTFNFIDSRTRSMSSQQITHKLYFQDGNAWTPVFYNVDDVPNPKAADASMFRIDSTLASAVKRGSTISSYRLQESARWYVPKPLVELILSCTQKSTR